MDQIWKAVEKENAFVLKIRGEFEGWLPHVSSLDHFPLPFFFGRNESKISKTISVKLLTNTKCILSSPLHPPRSHSPQFGL